MFRVPEALLHSGKRALAQGMYVRARAEVVDGEGMIIGDVNLEGAGRRALRMATARVREETRSTRPTSSAEAPSPNTPPRLRQAPRWGSCACCTA